MDLTKLGAREAATLIVEERLTAVRLTEACLERIEARDGELRAWAHLDPEAALAQARACDALAPAGPAASVAQFVTAAYTRCQTIGIALFFEAEAGAGGAYLAPSPCHG